MSTEAKMSADEKSESPPQDTKPENIECVLYYRRWLILFIFATFSGINALQWIQYSIISNVIEKYYSVSSSAVEWLSMIFMVTYIPLVFPASYFLDKRGLRICILIGTFGTAVGAWLKVISVRPDLFWVTFLGQTIVAVSQIFMLSLPPSIAAAWFGANEVSTACAIGVFGNQMGIALGFLLPPVIVENKDSIAEIGEELEVLFYGTAGFSTVIFILALLFFQDRPPTPPSPQQAMQKENASKNEDGFLKLLKRLLRNRSYVLVVLMYAINQGVFNAYSTLLNRLILMYFKDGEAFGGRVGLVFIIVGMTGGVVFGILLDATRRFRVITLGVFAMSLVGMIAFTFTLELQNEIVVYICSGVLGCFLGGYMPIAYDFCAELTYPEPEGMTSGLLTVPTQVSGTLFTLAYSAMLTELGAMWANVALCVSLLVGTVIHCTIKPDLRRQAVTASTDNLVKAEESLPS
ncbi:choline/ethanolamine transporter flvcr2a-like [Periplaneta americana]|uniref:choline/ethanolamine transporter flvcr2a-like n=1 Tax=Periplaneta americana TaxID=6978 RepID=UPI0037E7DDF8